MKNVCFRKTVIVTLLVSIGITHTGSAAVRKEAGPAQDERSRRERPTDFWNKRIQDFKYFNTDSLNIEEREEKFKDEYNVIDQHRQISEELHRARVMQEEKGKLFNSILFYDDEAKVDKVRLAKAFASKLGNNYVVLSLTDEQKDLMESPEERRRIISDIVEELKKLGKLCDSFRAIFRIHCVLIVKDIDKFFPEDPVMKAELTHFLWPEMKPDMINYIRRLRGDDYQDPIDKRVFSVIAVTDDAAGVNYFARDRIAAKIYIQSTIPENQ